MGGNNGYGLPSYGVQPLGNRFVSEEAEASHIQCRRGLGPFGVVEDDQLVEFFKHEAFSVRDLCMLTCVSKALYVICHQEEIWKEHCIRLHRGRFQFQGSWKRTVFHHSQASNAVCSYLHSHLCDKPRSRLLPALSLPFGVILS